MLKFKDIGLKEKTLPLVNKAFINSKSKSKCLRFSASFFPPRSDRLSLGLPPAHTQICQPWFSRLALEKSFHSLLLKPKKKDSVVFFNHVLPIIIGL